MLQRPSRASGCIAGSPIAPPISPAVHGLGLASTFLGWLRRRLMANGADLRDCGAHHHLPLRRSRLPSCRADRRCKPAVPPEDHRQGGRRAERYRQDRHGGVRQSRHADLGRPQLIEDERISDDALWQAAGLAAASKHPYARAIVAAAEKRLGRVVPVSGVEEVPGHGLKRILTQGEERLGSPSGVASAAMASTARSGIAAIGWRRCVSASMTV